MLVIENLDDLLKPKSKEEIDENINKIFNISLIREHIKKYKNNNIFCLYIYEVDWDWDSTSYYKEEENIIKGLIDSVLEAYKENWNRTLVIYLLDPNRDGQFVYDRKYYGYYGVKVLIEINLKESYHKETSEIELNFNNKI